MDHSKAEATRIVFRLGYVCAKFSTKPVPSTRAEMYDILDELGLPCKHQPIHIIDKMIDNYIKQHGDGAATLKL